ncbi:MAG: type II secretion system GspH family protein [Heliobacteriaceae bacterium]|jgi:prepilin-type N-terminal cleavage/methylation domain-containing protein|nr:type II secretion system GspH family protein [Heliobacteriaceae bacterium]
MRKGFTLAEVLITLGIIGVVAALTMPSLIQNFKRKEVSVKLKKFHSMMSQAVLLAEIENGKTKEWDFSLSSSAFFEQYLKPYLKTTSTNYANDTMYFADGSKVIFSRGACVDFVFDTNAEKRPNSNGYDRFMFSICPAQSSEWCGEKGWCATRPTVNDTREKALAYCKTNSRFCAGFLEFDNFEFKDDYPYKF